MHHVPLPAPIWQSATLLVALSVSASAQSPQAARPGQAVAAPRIPATSISRLLQVGSEADSTYAFLGLHRIEDGVSMLSITSARQAIAFSAAAAAAKGGTYTPPSARRLDVVMVSCGDADLGERWDCSKITVLNSIGRRVTPLSYSSGPSTYRNAVGATWTATKSLATFRLSDLVGGFSVRYAGTDGTEFTHAVSAAEVDHVLFAELPPTKAMRTVALATAAAERIAKAEAERSAKAAAAAAAKLESDAEPDPPPLFRGTIEAVADDHWRITSSTAGYTWRGCSLVSGIGKTPLGPLAPGVSVTVPRPSNGAPLSVRPVVHCTAKGRKFEGPVPAEFTISVTRKSAQFWTVRNLTDWAWKDCEIVVAEKVAAVPSLPPGVPVTVTSGDFRPGPPRLDAAPAVSDLSMSCFAYGARVEAVQRPTP